MINGYIENVKELEKAAKRRVIIKNGEIVDQEAYNELKNSGTWLKNNKQEKVAYEKIAEESRADSFYKKLPNQDLITEVDERVRDMHPKLEFEKYRAYHKSEPNSRGNTWVPISTGLLGGMATNYGLKRLGLDFGRTTASIGAGIVSGIAGLEANEYLKDLNPEHKAWKQENNKRFNAYLDADTKYKNKIYEALEKNKHFQAIAKQNDFSALVTPEKDNYKTINTIDSIFDEAEQYANKTYHR